jgi:hypothetical protein
VHVRRPPPPQVRMRYKMQCIMSTVMNAGNVKELYNMCPKERLSQISGRDDPWMLDKYVIRVYCLAPLYAFQHWEARGLYAAFQQWLKEHPE